MDKKKLIVVALIFVGSIWAAFLSKNPPQIPSVPPIIKRNACLDATFGKCELYSSWLGTSPARQNCNGGVFENGVDFEGVENSMVFDDLPSRIVVTGRGWCGAYKNGKEIIGGVLLKEMRIGYIMIDEEEKIAVFKQKQQDEAHEAKVKQQEQDYRVAQEKQMAQIDKILQPEIESLVTQMRGILNHIPYNPWMLTAYKITDSQHRGAISEIHIAWGNSFDVDYERESGLLTVIGVMQYCYLNGLQKICGQAPTTLTLKAGSRLQ